MEITELVLIAVTFN